MEIDSLKIMSLQQKYVAEKWSCIHNSNEVEGSYNGVFFWYGNVPRSFWQQNIAELKSKLWNCSADVLSSVQSDICHPIFESFTSNVKRIVYLTKWFSSSILLNIFCYKIECQPEIIASFVFDCLMLVTDAIKCSFILSFSIYWFKYLLSTKFRIFSIP